VKDDSKPKVLTINLNDLVREHSHKVNINSAKKVRFCILTFTIIRIFHSTTCSITQSGIGQQDQVRVDGRSITLNCYKLIMLLTAMRYDIAVYIFSNGYRLKISKTIKNRNEIVLLCRLKHFIENLNIPNLYKKEAELIRKCK